MSKRTSSVPVAVRLTRAWRRAPQRAEEAISGFGEEDVEGAALSIRQKLVGRMVRMACCDEDREDDRLELCLQLIARHEDEIERTILAIDFVRVCLRRRRPHWAEMACTSEYLPDAEALFNAFLDVAKKRDNPDDLRRLRFLASRINSDDRNELFVCKRLQAHLAIHNYSQDEHDLQLAKIEVDSFAGRPACYADAHYLLARHQQSLDGALFALSLAKAIPRKGLREPRVEDARRLITLLSTLACDQAGAVPVAEQTQTQSQT